MLRRNENAHGQEGGSEHEAFDLQRPYLKTILAFTGVTDVSEVPIEPALMKGPEGAQAAIAKARAAGKALGAKPAV